jgi:hypothetical protein
MSHIVTESHREPLAKELASFLKMNDINDISFFGISDGCNCCPIHRLSINRPTKRGREKSPSDGHCQCEKEMDDHLLACQQILEIEPCSDTPY